MSISSTASGTAPAPVSENFASGKTQAPGCFVFPTDAPVMPPPLSPPRSPTAEAERPKPADTACRYIRIALSMLFFQTQAVLEEHERRPARRIVMPAASGVCF